VTVGRWGCLAAEIRWRLVISDGKTNGIFTEKTCFCYAGATNREKTSQTDSVNSFSQI